MDKKTGIITFHASYNCGSMLQAFALQKFLRKNGYTPEIVDFSSVGQRKVYSVFSKNTSLKMFLRNMVIWLAKKRIQKNNRLYEEFKLNNFPLTNYSTSDSGDLQDTYSAVIAGADQIWNVTISDFDDAYFLNWVKQAKKIAYAPSFGARNIAEYATDKEKYRKLLTSFDALSIRENNGQKWIYELTGRHVPVVLDPTLLLSAEDYAEVMDHDLKLPERYIFYYSPSYSLDINQLVKKISKKYHLPVIAFNTKSFYLRGMKLTGFKLPERESPSAYLKLMQNAELVITTSFHGTIFSTIFKRKFWVVKNGGMYGTDDRVATLAQQLAITDRIVPIRFDENFDYMKEVNYQQYSENLQHFAKFSEDYLLSALEEPNETAK